MARSQRPILALSSWAKGSRYATDSTVRQRQNPSAPKLHTNPCRQAGTGGALSLFVSGDGGPGRDRTDNLFHAMEMQWTPVVDGKELTGRNGRQNRQNWRNLLPICYQNLRVGLRADLWGDQPSLSSRKKVHLTTSWQRQISHLKVHKFPLRDAMGIVSYQIPLSQLNPDRCLSLKTAGNHSLAHCLWSSKNARSLRERDGCRIFRRALASI